MKRILRQGVTQANNMCTDWSDPQWCCRCSACDDSAATAKPYRICAGLKRACMVRSKPHCSAPRSSCEKYILQGKVAMAHAAAVHISYCAGKLAHHLPESTTIIRTEMGPLRLRCYFGLRVSGRVSLIEWLCLARAAR